MKSSHRQGGVSRQLRVLWALCCVSCLPFVGGCRQDMHNQPKYRPLRASALFPDGSSARVPVEGTVARGTLQTDEAFFTGKVATQLVTELPFAVDEQVLNRGEQRYNIYCAPCHDRTGSGNGMVVQRGYRQPPSMHIDRLREVQAGHFFDVMTNGFGAMYSYADRISVEDRWNIAAYVQALQLSQNAEQSMLAPPATAPVESNAGHASSK